MSAPVEVGPELVRCAECGREKCPRGRDAPMESGLCGVCCEGYYDDPKPSSLWPGETREEFGYGG